MSLPTHSYLLRKRTQQLLKVVVTVVGVAEDSGTHQVCVDFSGNRSSDRNASVAVADIPGAIQIHSTRESKTLFPTLLQSRKLLQAGYWTIS